MVEVNDVDLTLPRGLFQKMYLIGYLKASGVFYVVRFVIP